jgi:hypothetical protein
MPDGSADDRTAAELLDADFRVWDDAGVDWEAYDLVVLRSVWDYTRRVDEFLAWCRTVGERRLRNSPALVAFNADKRYLAELTAPSVATTYVAPGDPLPTLADEVVVKPSVSAGARDTGRFGPETHDVALALIERIRASGRVALVQPHLASVGERGETSLVFLAGELSHVLTKHPVLRPDEVAPTAVDGLGPALAMLDDELVVAGAASAGEQTLAHRVLAEVSARFGGVPLYARVDLAGGPDGEPLLLELETIEPALYLARSPGAAERFAAAIRAA